MKKTFLLAGLLLVSASNAATALPYGLACNITFPGQRAQNIHFDIDDRVGKYTARIGDTVIRQAQAFQIEYAMGMNVQPSVRAIKLDYRNPPNFWFVTIDVKGTASVVGPTGRGVSVGFCSDAAFKGL